MKNDSLFFSMKLVIFILFTIVQSYASDPIIIDGQFNDWDTVPVLAADPIGDNIIEDFAELKMSNDNDYVFLYFTFHNGDQLLQSNNEVALYIDTDNNPTTGIIINAIGADLEWNFGLRHGFFHHAFSDSLFQNDITLRRGPNVSSEKIEIAISRKSKVFTLNGTQTADTISILFTESDPSGDFFPDINNIIQYIIDPMIVPAPTAISMQKHNVKDLRVVSYNVQNHRWNVFENKDMHPRLERVLKALNPDIIAFQHVHTDSTVDSLITKWFPENDWFMMGNYGPPGEYVPDTDKFIFSKYPIIEQSFSFIASKRIYACLIDTKQELGTELLLLNTHLPAYSKNDVYRQSDADKFIQAMREWKNGSGPFNLADNTPFIVLGDFNMYGAGQVLRTFIDGDILDEGTCGSDFPPDWDGTSLTDLFSRHTHIRMGYTWRQDKSEFEPAKIDLILYSNSVMEIGNHFILNTLAIPDEDLAVYGLQKEDTDTISQHLPHVMDIASVHSVGLEDSQKEFPVKFELHPAYPNPFNSSTVISYQLTKESKVTLKVYDITGQEMRTLVSQNQNSGEYSISFNASDLASGIYFYKLQAGSFEQSHKMLLLK